MNYWDYHIARIAQILLTCFLVSGGICAVINLSSLASDNYDQSLSTLLAIQVAVCAGLLGLISAILSGRAAP